MTIEYRCGQCEQVIHRGGEMNISGAAAIAVAVLTVHAQKTGHKKFDYTSEKSVLDIKVNEYGKVVVNGSIKS